MKNTISVHETYSAHDHAMMNKMRNNLRLGWNASIINGLCVMDFLQRSCDELDIGYLLDGDMFNKETIDKIEAALIMYAQVHKNDESDVVLDCGMELDVN